MKKKVILILLGVILACMSQGAVIFADSVSPVIVQNPFEERDATYNRTNEQLLQLKNLGIIQEEIQDIEYPTLPEKAYQYQEIEIMNQQSIVVIEDIADHKIYTDTDQYLEAKERINKSQATTPSALSINVYVVHFFSFVGNPDTADADYVHTAEVTDCIGVSCPDDYLVQLNLETSNNRYVGFSVAEYESDTVEEDEEVALIFPINDTKYYRYNSEVIALEGVNLVTADSGIGDVHLLNSYGKKYPLDYSDPQSGIDIFEPPANLSVNQQTRSSTFRTDFINYYELNWGTPEEFSWSEVEIHHNLPLKYGGSNAMSNGIPLMNSSSSHSVIPKHSYLTRWWQYY